MVGEDNMRELYVSVLWHEGRVSTSFMKVKGTMSTCLLFRYAVAGKYDSGITLYKRFDAEGFRCRDRNDNFFGSGWF